MIETFLEQLASRDAHWAVQFLKYAFCGGMATLADVLVFYSLAWRLIPALKHDDIAVRVLRVEAKPVNEQTRARNFVINTAIAFIFSNFVAYITNKIWVFEPGIHAWYVEILLFYAISLISIVAGAALGWAMIKYFKLSTTFSYIGKMIAALAINFIARKFIVFRV